MNIILSFIIQNLWREDGRGKSPWCHDSCGVGSPPLRMLMVIVIIMIMVMICGVDGDDEHDFNDKDRHKKLLFFYF